MNNPLVSIIIVNFNGYHLLKNCLISILKNSYSNYEIIIADNGSTDDSIFKIKDDFKIFLSKIKILNLKKNLGPSLARNEAFKHSKGEIIAFLDNDTEVDNDWIIKVLPLFKKNSKIGAIQCKLLLMDQKKRIDYTGELLGTLGFLKSVATYGEIDKGQYNKNYSILAAKSAGMFIRRKAFIDAGKFDPDYFIFMEETDLGWRTLLAGYQNIFCFDSIVYHKFSSTKDIVDKNFSNYLIRFHGSKNYIQTLIKNLSTGYLLKILPTHVFLWFSLATFLLITGDFKSAKNIYKGIFWNIINLKKIICKRKIVQKKRKVSDQEIFVNQKLMSKTKISYYLNKIFNPKNI